ncbi:hypothetical protein ACIPSA_37075 [Streptomyces sp. NPDC086549]|uniref:hypothetical protein n=1 Tax=Streptomyces sp. NPDC086549 TaxID=3365752 RepID=UPI003830CF71
MRAQRVTRLAAVSATAILMAGGAAIGAAGTAAASPAVHTRVTTDWSCGNRDDWNGRCFDNNGFRFGNRFDNGFGFGNRFDNGFRFDNRFDNGFRFGNRFDNHGFRFDNRFDHHGFFTHRGGVLIFVFS